MSEPAAMIDDARIIEGYYVDMRPIRTRKVLQIMVEVPIELASEVTKRLGWPDPVSGTRCAVALLNDSAKDLAGGSAPKDSPEGPSSSRSEVPPAKPNPHIRRFMALAHDRGFWNYLRRCHGKIVADEAQTVATLKGLCGITSREELADGSKGALALLSVANDFNAWRNGAP